MNKRVMAVLGDFWHAAGYVDMAILSKLEAKGYQIDRILDNNVPYENLAIYDLIVISRYGYDDVLNHKNHSEEKACWATAEEEKLIEAYVNEGGNILLHHDAFVYHDQGNGICNLAKAVFINHPIIGEIEVKPIGHTNDLNFGIIPYKIEEEEYILLDFDEEATQVFLESYSEKHGRHLLGWQHAYGDGKVVVYIPGHNFEVFQHPMVDQGIQNALEFLTKKH